MFNRPASDTSSSSSVCASEKKSYVLETPRYYQLASREEPNAEEVTFYVLGCAGDGQVGQQKVARLMNALAEKKAPSFVIMLGDNFYNNGVNSPTDVAFKKTFDNVYAPNHFRGLSTLPFFVVMGNHDHNLYSWGNKNGHLTPHKIQAQVLHTLLDNTGVISNERIATYSQPNLDMADLSRWNMPNRFYAVRYKNIELFFLDSCTYLKDFVRAQSAPEDMSNQANWFKQVASQHSDTTKMVFMHHALLSIGKRAFKFDSHYYLNAENLSVLNRMGIAGGYNEMLNTVIRKKQGLKIDSFFAAHDHSLYYHLDLSPEDPLCQIIAGGGGGSLQSRYSFKRWKDIPCYIKENGFVSVTTSLLEKKPQIIFDFHSIEGKHLQFDNQRTLARSVEVQDDLALKRLRECVLSAYENYLDFLRDRQDGHVVPGTFFFRNVSHGSAGAENADDIRNFFNQYNTPSFAAALLFLQRKLLRFTKQHANSFVTLIDHQLHILFNITYENLMLNPDIILQKPERKASDVRTPAYYIPELQEGSQSAEENSYEVISPLESDESQDASLEPRSLTRSSSDSVLYTEKSAYTR